MARMFEEDPRTELAMDQLGRRIQVGILVQVAGGSASAVSVLVAEVGSVSPHSEGYVLLVVLVVYWLLVSYQSWSATHP